MKGGWSTGVVARERCSGSAVGAAPFAGGVHAGAIPLAAVDGEGFVGPPVASAPPGGTTSARVVLAAHRGLS